MRVPRLSATSMLLTGIAFAVLGVVFRLAVYDWGWFGELYGTPELSEVERQLVFALDQVLVPLGVALVAGALVLAALGPRDASTRPDYP